MKQGRPVLMVTFLIGIQFPGEVKNSLRAVKGSVEITWFATGIHIKHEKGENWLYPTVIKQVDFAPDQSE